jgi:hypothetical protein
MAQNVQPRTDARPVLRWPSIAAASAALRPPRGPRDEGGERAVVLHVARPAGDAGGDMVAKTVNEEGGTS